MNAPLPELPCLIVRRGLPGTPGLPQYLITNGTNAGRWTLLFGSNCLADIGDCCEFARNIHADTPGSELIEYICRPLS